MAQQMKQLMRLCSLGVQSAWTLSSEVFAWRDIKNRRQLSALAGFTPTPYASGESQREQGISKAGIAGVRTGMIELSWLWLRYQSDSALSRWFQRRFGSTGSKRSRRIGIVALARRLLVALWRYLHQGVIPRARCSRPGKSGHRPTAQPSTLKGNRVEWSSNPCPPWVRRAAPDRFM